MAAGGGSRLEGGAVADDAGKPAACVGRGEVGAAGFEGGEQRGLNEIVGFVRPTRGAAGEGVQVCKGAGSGHFGRLARMRPVPKGARVTID